MTGQNETVQLIGGTDSVPTSPGPPVGSTSRSQLSSLGSPIKAGSGLQPVTKGHDGSSDGATKTTLVKPTEVVPDKSGNPLIVEHAIIQAVHQVPSKPVDGLKDEVLQDYEDESYRQQIQLEVHEKELQIEREKERERYVKGLDNDDLNALLRSFDKQVQAVEVCPPTQSNRIPVGLELQPAKDEEFSVVRLRSALERVYMSIGVGSLRALYEVQRIRNWEDGGQRTAIALAVYGYAWYCNILLVTFLAFVSILILFPSSRGFFFDQAIGSEGSKAGQASAPMDASKIAESRQSNPWGPAAIESKASTWAQNVQDIILAFSTPGKSKTGAQDIADQAAGAVDEMLENDMKKKEAAGTKIDGEEHDSRSEKAVQFYAQPAMRALGGIADKWERLANALNPQPDYSLDSHRVKIFLNLILPVILMVILTPAWIISKAIGAVIGTLLFAQPLISHLVEELDNVIPDWKQKLLLEYNFLETVPTNTQLVFRMLRQAEHKLRPLPAPRVPDSDDDDVSSSEEDETEEPEAEGSSESKSKKAFHEMSRKTRKAKAGTRAKVRKAWDALGKFKEESFATIAGRNPVDYEGKAEHALDKMHLKESKPGQALLKALPSAPKLEYPDAPARFYVSHGRHGPGHLIIYPSEEGDDNNPTLPARIEFTTVRKIHPLENDSTLNPGTGVGATNHLVISANDIMAIRKTGLSLPASTALGWALDTTGAGGTGMEIDVVRRKIKDWQTEGWEKDTLKFSSIVRRDELFDRLVAVGDQRWSVV